MANIGSGNVLVLLSKSEKVRAGQRLFEIVQVKVGTTLSRLFF
jgi:hypothetical protein